MKSKLLNVLIVWISIYPAISCLLFFGGEYINDLPLLIKTFVLTIILVPLMMLVLVPFWKIVFRKIGILND